jgi:hypothetical protein
MSGRLVDIDGAGDRAGERADHAGGLGGLNQHPGEAHRLLVKPATAVASALT